jgi:hypothetical protein
MEKSAGAPGVSIVSLAIKPKNNRVTLPAMKISASLLLLLLPACVLRAAEAPVYPAEVMSSFDAPEARQGIAVDDAFIYVINNANIIKLDKTDGQVVMGWRSGSDAIIHLDGGMILDGTLYAAHSNYPASPMLNSVEVRRASNLNPVATVPIAAPGSLTWLDRHDGAWWAGFGNYDIIPDGQSKPYGGTDNTRIARLNDTFGIEQSWSLPQELLSRLRPMSNSGGSWGADGYLYLSGHDRPEIYVMSVPEHGEELVWVATVTVPGFNGQGIAWDRSRPGRELWGIIRASNQVLRIRLPAIAR